MQPGSLGDNIQLGDLEALVSEANLLDPLLSINLEPQEVLQALQVQDSASPRLPAQPPVAPGAPIPPTNGCWGPKLSGLGNGCTPGFTVGKNHFKNKFCEACRANGLWLPHSRVRAITADQQELFTNKHQQGVWTEKTLADGHHVQYRLANHTQHCSGPWLLVFSSPSSVPALEWAPMPRHWLHRGGEWVRLIVTKGTLTPVRVQVDEEGGASPSSDSQASLLTALPVGGKSGPAWKRSKAVSASSSTDDARSAGDAASVSDAASTGDPEGGEEPSGVRLTLASLHERLTALVLQQFNRPREALEADGIDERQREAFLEMLAPVRTSADLLRRKRASLQLRSPLSAASSPDRAPQDDAALRDASKSELASLLAKLFGAIDAAVRSLELGCSQRAIEDEEVPFLLQALSLAAAAVGLPGGGGAAAPGGGAAAPPAMRRIDASSNYLSEVAVDHLAPLLRASAPALQLLDLSNNRLGDEGAQRLARVFCDAALPQLHALKLRWCQLSDPGVVALAQAMSTGQTPALAELELDANRIGDQGLTGLAGALLVAAPGTMALTELGLGNGYGGNLIGDVGLLSLLQAARAGRLARLRRLTLSNNEVSDEAAAQLTEIISEGAMPALRLVALQSNFIADYRLRPLSEECKRRSVTLLSSAQLTRSAHLQASAWVAA